MHTQHLDPTAWLLGLSRYANSTLNTHSLEGTHSLPDSTFFMILEFFGSASVEKDDWSCPRMQLFGRPGGEAWSTPPSHTVKAQGRSMAIQPADLQSHLHLIDSQTELSSPIRSGSRSFAHPVAYAWREGISSHVCMHVCQMLIEYSTGNSGEETWFSALDY